MMPVDVPLPCMSPGLMPYFDAVVNYAGKTAPGGGPSKRLQYAINAAVTVCRGCDFTEVCAREMADVPGVVAGEYRSEADLRAAKESAA